MELWDRAEKSPMLVYVGPSDTMLKGLTLGLGVSVLKAGLSSPTIRVSSQLASRLSDGVRTDLARTGAVPVQPAVDGEP